MKLLDYLEPMKNMPNRFSNLAFWRSVRYLKDVVVDAFTYVNSWGTGIETEQAKQNADIEKLESDLEVTNGKVEENADNITQLGKDLEVANGKIKANTDSISGLASDLQVAEGNIQTNSNNIVKLVSDLATTNENVTAATETANSANTAVGNLSKLVYDGVSTNWQLKQLTQIFTYSKIGDGFVFTPYTNYYDLDVVPHFISIEGYCKIYRTEDHTISGNVYVNIPYRAMCYQNKTKIIMDPVVVYAPYGLADTGLHVTVYYTTHK